MVNSKLGETHYFVFQHRDLVWSFSIENEKLEQHKEEILKIVEGEKTHGLNKIINGMREKFDTNEIETIVFNGCIQHAFSRRGDITKGNERVHWLYLSCGERGKFMEIDELEKEGYQFSFLSKSFTDKEIPNIDSLVKWKKFYQHCEEMKDEETGKFYDVFRTLLHSDILMVSMKMVGSRIKKGDLKDKRDEYLFNEIFNVNNFQIVRWLRDKEFRSTLKEVGADEFVESLDVACNNVLDTAMELYGSEQLYKHISFAFYNGFSRSERVLLSSDKKMVKTLQKIVRNPKESIDDLGVVIKFLKSKKK